MKRPILLYLHSIQGGGAERFFLTLANGLSPDLFEVHVVLGSDHIKDYEAKFSASIKLHYLYSKASKKSLIKLAKLIRQIRPQLAFTTINKNNLTLLAASILSCHQMPIVVREANHLSKTEYSSRKVRFLTRWLYNLKASQIVAVSNGVKDDLVNHYKIKKAKISIIYTPIDLEKIHQLGQYNPYDDEQPNRIVHVGSFTSQKDHRTLLEAFALVLKDMQAHLTLVGDGPLKSSILEDIKLHNLIKNVTLTGFVQNPFGYVYHSDLFVLSSKYEGFPNVLLEAMALHTPIVSTDCPSGPNEIIDDGVNGLLVPVESKERLAKAMLTLLKNADQRVKYADSAYEKVQSFSLSSQLKAYETLFLSRMDEKL